MNLHDEFYPLVVEMLDEFGGNATLISAAPAAPTIDAKRSGRPAPKATPRTRPVRAAVGPIAIKGSDGRSTLQSVATMLAEPVEGDQLKQGDVTWTIGSVTRVAPQGKAIVFIAEVS